MLEWRWWWEGGERKVGKNRAVKEIENKNRAARLAVV